MTKQEIIEKYGEETYSRYQEVNQANRRRKYYENLEESRAAELARYHNMTDEEKRDLKAKRKRYREYRYHEAHKNYTPRTAEVIDPYEKANNKLEYQKYKHLTVLWKIKNRERNREINRNCYHRIYGNKQLNEERKQYLIEQEEANNGYNECITTNNNTTIDINERQIIDEGDLDQMIAESLFAIFNEEEE